MKSSRYSSRWVCFTVCINEIWNTPCLNKYSCEFFVYSFTWLLIITFNFFILCAGNAFIWYIVDLCTIYLLLQLLLKIIMYFCTMYNSKSNHYCIVILLLKYFFLLPTLKFFTLFLFGPRLWLNLRETSQN